MSLKPLHIATKGFLAGTTLAIAVSGFLQPDATIVPVKPFAPSQQRYVEPRKPVIIHALDFELASSSSLKYKFNSSTEFRVKTAKDVEYSSISLLSYEVTSEKVGKNVRVTELASNSIFSFDASSEVETNVAASVDTKYSSVSVFALNANSNISVKTSSRNIAEYASSSEIYLSATSNVKFNIVTDNKDDEIIEVLAVAINYLYG